MKWYENAQYFSSALVAYYCLLYLSLLFVILLAALVAAAVTIYCFYLPRIKSSSRFFTPFFWVMQSVVNYLFGGKLEPCEMVGSIFSFFWFF